MATLLGLSHQPQQRSRPSCHDSCDSSVGRCSRALTCCFRGSDCGASSDVFFKHNYTKLPEQSAAAMILAGQDVDCSGFTTQYAAKALAQKLLTPQDIDSRIANLFRVRFRLGHFDPPGPLHALGAADICSDAAVALARDGATQGTCMLKNTNSRLPLRASEAGSIAVLGPNANLSSLDCGY